MASHALAKLVLVTPILTKDEDSASEWDIVKGSLPFRGLEGLGAILSCGPRRSKHRKSVGPCSD